jgi:hypothetical protein
MKRKKKSRFFLKKIYGVFFEKKIAFFWAKKTFAAVSNRR